MRLENFSMSASGTSSGTREDDRRSLKETMSGLDYDQIYIEAWKSTIARCERGLEQNDLKEALQVKSAEPFRLGLKTMLENYPDGSAEADVLLLLIPILEHYDQFANSFAELMRNKLEVSIMWGLLFLVIKLALGSPGALERVNCMVKSVGIKLEYMNEMMCNLTNTEQKKNVYVEVSKELVNIWLNIIYAFRDSDLTGLKDATWEVITTQFGKVLSQLEEASERMSRILSLSLSKSHKDDFERLQALLREETSSTSKIAASNVPHMMPSPKNTRFYGREAEISRIHSLLAPSPGQKGLHSTAIYGLGGVGKSQIALTYAQQNAGAYDAIFWIHAQTLASLEQSFIKAVRLLGLGSENHDTQSRIVFLDWLQSTDKTWLLIFDNAENTEWILRYWPVSDRGSALMTTRRHIFGMHPASTSIPINPFSIDEGADFIFHILGAHTISIAEERKAATTLSELVGGHALALTQASSLIFKKKWSISKYLEMHARYPERIRDAHSFELMHAGYTEGVKTVFVLSFQSLSRSASTILGILSLLAPDGIPESLFSVDERVGLPTHLQFCSNEFEVSDIIEELISLALVQRDADTNKLSIHRLVQSEFRYYIKETLQESFDDTSKLLYESFPKQVYGRTFKPYFEQCSIIIQHLYFVRDHARNSVIPLQPCKEFCRLMCNGAYYLVEKGATKELETVVNATMEAFKSTKLIHEDVLAYAHLCNTAALEREMSGYFDEAKTLLELARDIRCRELPSGHEDIWVVMNNLGNLNLSLQKYDDALRFHLICQQTVASVRGNRRMNLINLGRVYTGLGRFNDAMDAFNKSKEYWDTVEPEFRSVYYWVGNMYMCEANWDEAETIYEKGRDRLKANGENISANMATCLYKLGLIALRRYNASKQAQAHALSLAVDHFKEAVTMMEFWKVADCEIARASYMLSVALFLQSSDEAIQWREKAESVRKTMQGENYLAEAHGEWVYDSLVESWVR